MRDWRVVVERALETESSLVAFGSRDGEAVVLKVVRHQTDERRCGEITHAFDGKGLPSRLVCLESSIRYHLNGRKQHPAPRRWFRSATSLPRSRNSFRRSSG